MTYESIARQHGLELVWVDDCIGTRRRHYICLNKNLKNHPEYLNEVFNHELRHSDGYTKKDILMDAVEGSLFKTLWFCFKYPKAFKSFLPVDRFKGEWYIDVTTILLYVFIIVMVIIFAR